MSKQKKEKQPPVLGRLLAYAGGHRWLSVLGCGLSGVSAAVGIFPFVFVWYAARGILTPGGGVSAGLARYGWYALAAALLSAAIYFAGLMCTHLAAFRVATNMRKAAAAHLIDLPLGYFNANLTGRLRKQIDDNAALTETLLAHTIPDAVGGIVTPILAVGLLFVFDWRMGLACLIPMVIGLVCLMTMMTGTSMKFFEEYQRAGERISAEATEYVRGIPVVKVFQQTVYSFKSFHAAILSYRDLASGYAMMCRMPYTLLTVVLNAMFLLLMPLGMVLIGGAADGWAVLADLVFYIFFAPQLAFMMERLMYAVNAQMEAAEAVNKLEAILKESPLPEPAADSGSKPADSGISFENVTFSYDGADRPALTNVSFHLPQGEAWALVGPSGGGKTTIARLIPRFFDAQAGAVLLGGRDVRSIPTAELMEQISFVFQEVRLFKKSIRDNIRAARPDATEAEILHAAQLAQCSDILEKTPGGLDAVIGAKGVYLSGGEMQRIALARAILKDAPIVVLDEASSFADPENEAKIQKAFEALMKGKTVLMIAHRLSTVRNMDRILVVRDGEIAEEGAAYTPLCGRNTKRPRSGRWEVPHDRTHPRKIRHDGEGRKRLCGRRVLVRTGQHQQNAAGGRAGHGALRHRRGADKRHRPKGGSYALSGRGYPCPRRALCDLPDPVQSPIRSHLPGKRQPPHPAGGGAAPAPAVLLWKP